MPRAPGASSMRSGDDGAETTDANAGWSDAPSGLTLHGCVDGIGDDGEPPLPRVLDGDDDDVGGEPPRPEPLRAPDACADGGPLPALPRGSSSRTDHHDRASGSDVCHALP